MSESVMKINPSGSKTWKNKAGQLHRTDGPAIEHADGTKMWAQNGICHRLDGPAIIWNTGSKEWYHNGNLHRTDGPAIEWFNGDLGWFYMGKNLGRGQDAFWALWDCLDEEGRQNVNLHMWLTRLTNV